MITFASIITNEIGGDTPRITKSIFDKEYIIKTKPDDYTPIYKDCINNTIKKQVYISTNLIDTLPIISGINEKYMEITNDKYYSKMKILFFSNYDELYDDTNNSLLSQLLGWIDTQFKEHKLTIKPEQIIFIGLNDIDYDFELNELDKYNIEYYTLSLIKKKGIKNILENIVNKNNNIMAYFNLEVFDNKLTPAVIRRNLTNLTDTNNKIVNGLTHENFENIMDILKNKVNYLIISGFNKDIFNITNLELKITNEIIQLLYTNIMDLKEYKINVFNENTRFLIYREMMQYEENDIGWYILRFIPLELKQNLLKHIDDDSIKILNLEDYNIELYNEDYDKENDEENNNNLIMISATTINDQNERSFYTATSILDCVLFPIEKISMGFELIN
jgi:hypothetical protein